MSGIDVCRLIESPHANAMHDVTHADRRLLADVRNDHRDIAIVIAGHTRRTHVYHAAGDALRGAFRSGHRRLRSIEMAMKETIDWMHSYRVVWNRDTSGTVTCGLQKMI